MSGCSDIRDLTEEDPWPGKLHASVTLMMQLK